MLGGDTWVGGGAPPEKQSSDKDCLARLSRADRLRYHALDDIEVREIALRRNRVLGRHGSEMIPIKGLVQRLAGLPVHEGEDLVAHGVVVVGMVPFFRHGRPSFSR